jgi:hypothetical protein
MAECTEDTTLVVEVIVRIVIGLVLHDLPSAI